MNTDGRMAPFHCGLVDRDPLNEDGELPAIGLISIGVYGNKLNLPVFLITAASTDFSFLMLYLDSNVCRCDRNFLLFRNFIHELLNSNPHIIRDRVFKSAIKVCSVAKGTASVHSSLLGVVSDSKTFLASAFRGSSLFTRLTQDYSANKQAVNFIGTFQDPICPAIPIIAFCRIVADMAIPTMDL